MLQRVAAAEIGFRPVYVGTGSYKGGHGLLVDCFNGSV
jgi:hypothetical protein